MPKETDTNQTTNMRSCIQLHSMLRAVIAAEGAKLRPRMTAAAVDLLLEVVTDYLPAQEPFVCQPADLALAVVRAMQLGTAAAAPNGDEKPKAPRAPRGQRTTQTEARQTTFGFDQAGDAAPASPVATPLPVGWNPTLESFPGFLLDHPNRGERFAQEVAAFKKDAVDSVRRHVDWERALFQWFLAASLIPPASAMTSDLLAIQESGAPAPEGSPEAAGGATETSSDKGSASAPATATDTAGSAPTSAPTAAGGATETSSDEGSASSPAFDPDRRTSRRRKP